MIFGLGPVPRMGIRGAAWATGLGQLLTLAAYLFFAWIRPLPVRISLKSLKFDLILLKNIYAVGIPATLNMALSSLLISSLNAILAVYGQMYVMILGVYYKLQTFLYLPANGIIQGMRPLIGYNYGAGEQKRVHKLYSYTLYLSAGIMLTGTLLCSDSLLPTHRRSQPEVQHFESSVSDLSYLPYPSLPVEHSKVLEKAYRR